MKKCTVFLLTAVFLFSAFAGCAPGTPPADSSSDTASIPPESAATEPQTSPPESEPAGPYEFTLANPGTEYIKNPRLAVEKEITDIYPEIEEREGIKILFILPDSYFEIGEKLVVAHSGNKKLADFIRMHQRYWAPAALAGMLRPLNTQAVRDTGLDVADPEIVDTVYSGLSTLTKSPGADIFGLYFSGRYFICNYGPFYAFNKETLENHGYSPADLYSIVRKGEWTWSKFLGICEKVTEEKRSNGDPQRWGLANIYMEAELVTNAAAPMRFNTETKRWESGWLDKDLQNAALYALHCSTTESICIPDRAATDNSVRRQIFGDGVAAFACVHTSHLARGGSGIDWRPFGVLPLPIGSPGTRTVFGALDGVAQIRGKDLPTKGYRHILNTHIVYVLQAVNPDWQRACHIMSLIGEEFSDPEATEKNLLSHFRSDQESLRIFNTYIKPTSELNALNYSPGIQEAFDTAIEEIHSAGGSGGVFSRVHELLQSAIDETFGYTK